MRRQCWRQRKEGLEVDFDQEGRPKDGDVEVVGGH